MISCVLIAYSFSSLYCSSFPDYFITKIILFKDII